MLPVNTNITQYLRVDMALMVQRDSDGTRVSTQRSVLLENTHMAGSILLKR